MDNEKVERLVTNLYDWAAERYILNGSAEKQGAKLISKLGELMDATIKYDNDAIADALGDMSVVMVSFTTLALGIEDRKMAIDELTTLLSETLAYGRVSISESFEFSYLITVCVRKVVKGLDIKSHIRLLFAYINTFAIKQNIDLFDCIDAAWLEIKAGV